MFEERESGSFSLPIDFPSASSTEFARPVSKRELNASVIERFLELQQAEVALAESVNDWDAADAWTIDGALSASAWLKSKLAISRGRSQSILHFAR